VVSVEPATQPQALRLRAAPAYQKLRDLAEDRGMNLDQSLFVEMDRLGCGSGRRLIVEGAGAAACLRAEIYVGPGSPVFQTDACRGGDDVALSPTAIDALNLAPAAGTVSSSAGWNATRMLVEKLKAQFAGKGEFDVTKRGDAEIRFTVKGMRDQILAGQKWWEWLDVSLWLVPPEASRPASLRWEATARYGAGILRPPLSRAGYTNDIEPAHQRELVDYVNGLLGRIRDSL
jgi:hypothetical protein